MREALPAQPALLIGLPVSVVGDRWRPKDLASSITLPMLAVAAGAGSPLLPAAAEAPAAAMPDARPVTMDGQTHDIDPTVLGPLLEEFLVR